MAWIFQGEFLHSCFLKLVDFPHILDSNGETFLNIIHFQLQIAFSQVRIRTGRLTNTTRIVTPRPKIYCICFSLTWPGKKECIYFITILHFQSSPIGIYLYDEAVIVHYRTQTWGFHELSSNSHSSTIPMASGQVFDIFTHQLFYI